MAKHSGTRSRGSVSSGLGSWGSNSSTPSWEELSCCMARTRSLVRSSACSMPARISSTRNSAALACCSRL
eukprot:4763226-Heterocapsa_arctica.AAC.1